MKKGTKIAFVITLVYCLVATYELYSISNSFKVSHNSIFPEWIEYSLVPGYFLGLVLKLGVGWKTFGPIIGQLITFFILFFLLKTLINSIFFRSKN